MTRKAGERLFEAIGQLPAEIILEAENGGPEKGRSGQVSETGTKLDGAGNQPERGKSGQEPETGTKADTAGSQPEKGMTQQAPEDQEKRRFQKKRIKNREWSEKIGRLGGYMKYLPVAACLCLVCSGVVYFVNNYMYAGKSSPYAVSDTSGSGGLSKSEETAMNGQAVSEDVKESEDFDDAASESVPVDDAAGESGPALSGGGMMDQPELPARNDAYEGPVLSMTATGDAHNLKTKRWLQGTIDTEEYKGLAQPLLSVKDTYEIENNSKEDKTLQLVYPFVATLNQAYDLDGEVIQIAGQDEKSVSYNIGDSVRAYWEETPAAQSTIEDYKKLFEKAQQYQEHAFEKEVDWSRTVSVYTFTDIRVNDADGGYYPGVAGVKVKGEGADVLTYGFDHSFEKEDGESNYCFFIPKEPEQIMMIVTGEPDEEPELGFYANLDCEEIVDGITCEVKKEEMSYANALRLSSKAASRQAQQDYETGVYDGRLPEYFNDDAVFKALTAAGDEDSFFANITGRYHTTELREIYEQLLGEVRIVYAVEMVTIPAGQSVRVEALAQKRQYYGHYALLEETGQLAGQKEYQFDFMMDDNSRLNIEKTVFRLDMPSEWRLADENLKLKNKGSSYRAVLKEKTYYMTIKKNRKE